MGTLRGYQRVASWPVLLTHRIHARTLSVILCLLKSLSLSLSAGAWDRAKSETGLSSPVPDQQRSCPYLFFVISWFPNRTFLILFVRTKAAAALRKSGKSKARSSNQSWSPNSGQVAEDGSQSPIGVFVSEQDQQPPACNLTLPQIRNDQTGMHTQSASSPLDQPQGASCQYQPTGNDQTSLAGNDLNSTAIVDAQLTPPVSRNDDTEMPAAPLTHDISTPCRRIGGRCRKCAVSTQQPSDK